MSTEPIDSSAEEERYFHALVKEYESARSDERNWFLLAGAFITLIVTTLGAIAFEIESDALACLRASACNGQTNSLVTLFPLAPLAALGMIGLAGMQSAIRGRYMRVLEAEIRRLTGREDSAVRPLPGRMGPERAQVERAFLLRWTDLSSGINETRRGQTLYRTLVHGLFLGITIIYAALLVFIGLHVAPWDQAALISIYITVSAILFGALFKSWLGSEALWEEVTAALALTVNRAAALVEDRPDPMPGRRPVQPRASLALYLIFPRTTMFVARLALTFFGALILEFVAASPGPSQPAWRAVGITALFAFVFEWGPYSARNQWTDLRRRERLPRAPRGASLRANLYTSAIVLALRVIISYLWVAALVPGVASWAGAIGGILLLSSIWDAWFEYRERRNQGRTLATRSAEVIGRAAAFLARGLAAWQIALFVGAHVSASAWVGEIAALVLVFSAPWVIYSQLRDAAADPEHPSAFAWTLLQFGPVAAAIRRGNVIEHRIRRVVRTSPLFFGRVLLGRAFEQWLRRKGAGIDEILSSSVDQTAENLPRIYEWTETPRNRESAAVRDDARNGHVISIPTLGVLVLVDPPSLSNVQHDELRRLENIPPTDILLTTPAHLREASEHRERWGCTIWLPDDSSDSSTRGIATFESTSRLWGEIAVVGLHGLRHATEVAFFIRDVLIVGDALCGGWPDEGVSYGDIGIPSPPVLPDELEAAYRSLNVLLGRPFTSVCFGHGTPIVENGHEALERFLKDELWNAVRPTTAEERTASPVSDQA